MTPFPFVTKSREKTVAPLVGSTPQLKPYKAIKGRARAERRHHIQTIMRELVVDPEVVGDCTSVSPGTTSMTTLV